MSHEKRGHSREQPSNPASSFPLTSGRETRNEGSIYETAFGGPSVVQLKKRGALGIILVPRGRDHFGQHQESRPLARADFLNMRRVLVLHFQPIRFARFDKESVNRGLPVSEPARG